MKDDKKKIGPAYRKVYKVQDLINRNEKNEALIPYTTAGIVQEAYRTNRKDIGQFFAKYVDSSPEELALLNAELIAESYFGMLQNSKVVSAHGYDLDNGVDVKTCIVRPGAVVANIGNMKNKKKISVLITVQDVGIIESIAPIPTPGDAKSLSIPLTRTGKIWKNYEFSHCFRPEDVEEDVDRGEFVDKWTKEEKVHFYFRDEQEGNRKWYRYRTVISQKKIDNVKNGFKPVCTFNGMEVELDPIEFLNHFGETFKNRNQDKYYCSVGANEDGTIKCTGKYASIFPSVMLEF